MKSVSNAVNGHGKVTLNKTTGNVVFTPDADFSGIATFNYTLVDSRNVSTVHTATIDVAPVADAPNLSATLGSAGAGIITREGGEVLINTTTRGGQFLSSMATYPDGRYVVAWMDTSYSGGDNFTQVRAQRFNADGSKAGTEFRVNTTTDSAQVLPKVSVLDNGDFVVVWNSEDDLNAAVRGQVYHADGAKVGGEFVANTTQGSQNGASVTALANGNFVVSWVDRTNPDDSEIKAQLFHDDGTQITKIVNGNSESEFRLNTITLNDQDQVSIAALKGANSGGFVATWRDNSFLRGDETRSGSIIAQRFDDHGNKVGGEVLVDTKGINFVNESPTVTGLSNGGFVVTWEASANVGPDTQDSSIDVQFFDASGNKVGPMLVANTSAPDYQKFPVVAELDNGYVAVAWTDNSTLNGDDDPASIKMQIFDPAGHRVGGEILVNTSTAEYQQFPSLIALPGGRVMVSWSDQSGMNDPEDDGIVRQIFSVGGAAPNAPLQLNIAASLTDKDGSETLAVSISNLLSGATLTDGIHSFTATAGNTSVDITGWSFASLTVQPPHDFVGDFQFTVSATSTERADVNHPNTVSQNVHISFAPNTTGGTGNDVLFGGSGNDVLTGGGGNDTYQFGHDGGQDRIVNGTATSTAASGELDFGAGVSANQLWFQRNGNDLSIAVMGSHDQVAVAGWFGGAGAQLQEIKTADGMKIDAGVSQLVQAMATYASAHAGFDPTTATQAPSDTSLQNAIATAWHA